MKINHIPLIKWTGSKRLQAKYIIEYFPKNINTYYEPFCGSCALTFELLYQIYLGNIKCKQIICSDLNTDLINFYNLFLNNKDMLFNEYEKLYNELINCKSIDEKKQFYFKLRDTFNALSYNDERTCIFYWLLRTCFNGLIRYNKNGIFNSSYHLNRNGIKPNKLKQVFDSWSFLINYFLNNGGIIKFYNESYDKIFNNVNTDDFLYLDPPYNDTKGMYYYSFNNDNFLNDLINLNNKNVYFALSYNGIRGNINKTIDIPKFYKKHIYIEAGNSSFNKLQQKNIKVQDSLYLNY